MKEETGYFSSFDGTKLFYRALENDSPNALIIIHGIGEHSGRYHELIEALSELPLSIFALDLRGHGHSEGDRVHINKFEDFVEDIYRFRAFILDKKAGKQRNFILLGQSLGGLISTHVVLRSQDDWKKFILLSPFFGLPFGFYFCCGLASLLNWLSPKRIWKNPIKPVFLTRDLEQVEIYKRDSLIQRQLTGCFANEMFKAVISAISRAKEITIPLFILASGSDFIVSTSKTKRFFNRVSSREKQIEVFEGCYHELLHELDRSKPIGMIKEYLQQCLTINLKTGRH